MTSVQTLNRNETAMVARLSVTTRLLHKDGTPSRLQQCETGSRHQCYWLLCGRNKRDGDMGVFLDSPFLAWILASSGFAGCTRMCERNLVRTRLVFSFFLLILARGIPRSVNTLLVS